MPKWKDESPEWNRDRKPHPSDCLYEVFTEDLGNFISGTDNETRRDQFIRAHNADIDALTAERDEIQRRLSGILDRLPDGGVWCYACNRATVPIYCKNFYEHIPREYKQMKTTFHCPICKRETYAKDSCVDSLRAIAEGREG